jgi:cytochrome c oxidase assembly protein subunit 15
MRFRLPGAVGVARLARVTALCAFGLIVLGAVVRSTGSGLACPDWPLCHGRLVPPLQTQVLLEWFHRLVAFAVSLLTIGLAVAIFAQAELRRALGVRLVVALGLLVMQIVLGALTVWRLLQYAVVTWHLGNALLFLLALLSIAERAQRLAEGRGPERQAPWGVRVALAAATVATLLQTLVGGLVSTNHAGLACPDFPGCRGELFPPLEGLVGLQMIHRLGAYLLFAFVVLVAFGTRRVEDPRIRAAALVAPALVVLQVALGVFNVLLAVPVWITAAHLATATALFAVLALAALRALARPRPEAS